MIKKLQILRLFQKSKRCLVYSGSMRIWHRDVDSVHAFYVNGLLRSLFMSMTTIFIPLFIYTQGMSKWGSFNKALLLVALYFIVERALIIFIVFPLSKLIERIGFRRSISLSVVFLMGYTIALLLTSRNLNWLLLAVLFGSLQIPMYWISRDSALSQDIPDKEMGRKIGYIAVLENISGLLGPFSGGAIVAFFGYQMLFIVAFAILLLSAIPLWWMPHHTHKNGVSISGFWYFLTNGRYLHQAVANFGIAINDYGSAVIWPLILFLQGIQDKSLGAIYSIVAIVTIAVQYATGKWFDKLRSKKDYSDEGVYGIASFGVSVSWIARLFAHGITQVLPVDIVRQLFGGLYSNFYSDYIHLGGKRMGSIAYWVYLEVIYSVGTVFIFAVMMLGIYFGIWKEMVLVTIALWSLTTIVAARESNMR